MQIDFTGKVVAVTGAAGGLGSAMVRRFSESGAAVAVCGRRDGRTGRAEALAAEIAQTGRTAKAYALDVSDRENVAEVCRQIAADLGGIDVWVNNAGINVGPEQRRNVDQFDDGWWDAIVKVDLDGVYNCSKAAVSYLKKRPGSNLVNISSIVGLVPLRRQCAFTAAKAGVVNFSKAMALELAEFGIRVNVVAPGTIGIVKTNKLWTDPTAMEGLLSHIPMHRQGTPDEIADTVLFLSSDRASYITGTVLTVDGGWLCGYARDF